MRGPCGHLLSIRKLYTIVIHFGVLAYQIYSTSLINYIFTCLSFSADPHDPISIDDLEKHVNGLKANSNYGFSQEYAKFDKKLKHPCTYSAHSVNSLKNRYANIHAYDHSRVVLQGDGTPGSDYINANYIRGFNGDQEYIAAQGPLPETISDFWRMVWEKSCSTIVMVGILIEDFFTI